MEDLRPQYPPFTPRAKYIPFTLVLIPNNGDMQVYQTNIEDRCGSGDLFGCKPQCTVTPTRLVTHPGTASAQSGGAKTLPRSQKAQNAFKVEGRINIDNAVDNMLDMMDRVRNAMLFIVRCDLWLLGDEDVELVQAQHDARMSACKCQGGSNVNKVAPSTSLASPVTTAIAETPVVPDTTGVSASDPTTLTSNYPTAG